jgi:hypothetical protein
LTIDLDITVNANPGAVTVEQVATTVEAALDVASWAHPDDLAAVIAAIPGVESATVDGVDFIPLDEEPDDADGHPDDPDELDAMACRGCGAPGMRYAHTRCE